jgi:hypothetical protein
MSGIIDLFAMFGTFSIDCVIVALAACGFAFAGGCLGQGITLAAIGKEDPGVSYGLPWGCVFGIVFSIYCLFSFGLLTGFLASLGLGICVTLVGGLLWLIFAPGPLPEDYPC